MLILFILISSQKLLLKVTQERIAHPDTSLRFLRFETPVFKGERHRHSQVELTWIERGVGLRFVGDSAAPFDDNDMVLIGPNVPHAWVGSADIRHQRSIATVLQFPLDLLQQSIFPELHHVAAIVGRARFGLSIGGKCRNAVIQVLTDMRAANRFGRLAGLIEILGLLAAKRASLKAIASSPMISTQETKSDRRVDRVIDWIHSNLANELDVVHAAEIAHVSPAAFSRYFHREVGKTFTRYINDVRCGEACIKLRQSVKLVSIIASECGFKSAAHFNRQFRLRMGMVPREYRRTNQ